MNFETILTLANSAVIGVVALTFLGMWLKQMKENQKRVQREENEASVQSDRKNFKIRYSENSIPRSVVTPQFFRDKLSRRQNGFLM